MIPINVFKKTFIFKTNKKKKDVKLSKKLKVIKPEFKTNNYKSFVLQGAPLNVVRFKHHKLANEKFFEKSFKEDISMHISFKFSYEVFSIIKTLLNFSREFFLLNYHINKVDLNNIYSISLKFKSYKNNIFKTKYKNYIKNILKNTRKNVIYFFNKIELVHKYNTKELNIKKNLKYYLKKVIFKKYQRLLSILNHGFFFTFLLKSNNIYEFNKIFKRNIIIKFHKIFFRFYILKQFRNYFLKSSFWGFTNRFFYSDSSISLEFSDVFSLILLNFSNFFSRRKLLSS